MTECWKEIEPRRNRNTTYAEKVIQGNKAREGMVREKEKGKKEGRGEINSREIEKNTVRREQQDNDQRKKKQKREERI